MAQALLPASWRARPWRDECTIRNTETNVLATDYPFILFFQEARQDHRTGGLLRRVPRHWDTAIHQGSVHKVSALVRQVCEGEGD